MHRCNKRFLRIFLFTSRFLRFLRKKIIFNFSTHFYLEKQRMVQSMNMQKSKEKYSSAMRLAVIFIDFGSLRKKIADLILRPVCCIFRGVNFVWYNNVKVAHQLI